MTIPEGASEDSMANNGDRVRRPEPQRPGPIRSRDGDPAEGDDHPSHAISEEIARAVRQGYDVIADNIQQGRLAAEQFRQGDYNFRQVPGDLEKVAHRMINLARELSNTTFEVCDRMLSEMMTATGGRDRTQDLPAFRPATPKPSGAKPPAADRMTLTVRFAEGTRALANPQTLARPKRPTAPGDISASPLAPRSGGGAPISGVTFEADLAQGGLIATVTAPQGQEPGFYSGLVFGGNEDVPLGVLTIEMLK